LKLYHWRLPYENKMYQFLVMEQGTDKARGAVRTSLESWRWQNPKMFDDFLKQIEYPPTFVAEAGYVITTADI
jgi:hypothetical protein